MKTRELFLSCLVDTFEQRNVIIAKISGVLLSANWQIDASDCHVRSECAMVDILCQIKPEYLKHKNKWWRRETNTSRQSHQGNLRNFVRCGIVLYQTKRGPNRYGLRMNDYNEYTFNKMINDKQCIIQFHVDDLK